MTRALVILAAGMGSRFGGPKQLEPLGPAGETMMDYAVFDAHRAGFDEVVVVTRSEIADAVRASLQRSGGWPLPIRYVLQRLDDLPSGTTVPAGRTKPWGTGHAVLAAAPAVHGSFAVVNADDFYGAASYRIIAEFLRGPAAGPVPEYAVVGFALRDTLSAEGGVNRARLDQSADGWLQHVEELRGIEPSGDGARYRDAGGRTVPLAGDQLVSMNMWAFTPALFAQLRAAFTDFLVHGAADPAAEFLLPTVVEQLIMESRARVRVLPGGGPWCGVTYPHDAPKVAAALGALVERGDYPSPLRR